MNANNQSEKVDRFEEIQDGLEYLTGESEVSLNDLLSDGFIRRNTDFDTLAAMLKSAGVKTRDDFQNANFTSFVQRHTRFADWDEMLAIASNQYAKKSLGI